MRRFRFHIGTLVILVLLLGVGFAALRESNETWDSSIYSITLGVLLTSILLAIHRTEKRRAFWLGFALFGSAYLGLSLVPSIEPRLITTKALAYLDETIMGRSHELVVYVDSGDSVGGWTSYRTPKAPPGSPGEHCISIGHSFLALIAALMGGLLSRHLHASDRQRTSGLSSPEHVPEPTMLLSGPSQ